MRIAFVIGSLREGGAEGQVVELARGLKARGHAVAIALLRMEGVRIAAARGAGVELIDLGLPRLRGAGLPGALGAVAAMKRTVGVLRRWQPGVLHPWLFEADAWCAVAKLLGAPGILVQSRLNLGYYKDARRWIQPVHNGCNRLSRAVVANSEEVARDVRARERLRRAHLEVIYGGVDATRYADAPPADLAMVAPGASHIVLSVANLYEYKGYLDLVDAWPSVLAELPDAHLLCAGKDEGIGEELARRIAVRELGARIHLLGSRDDIPALLAASDLLVLASHEEGFPNVLLEAMSAGRAAVATRVGGSAEALGNGEAGRLVPARDPAALAGSIVELLRDQPLRDSLGAAGRARVARLFSLERFIEAHERLYASLRKPT